MTLHTDKNRKSKVPSRQPEQHDDDALKQHDISSTTEGALPALNPQTILRLQRVIGNQAVQRLLAKRGLGKPASPAPQPVPSSIALQLRRQIGSTPNSRLLIQRAPVKTWAGEWDTKKYNVVKLSEVRKADYIKKNKLDPDKPVGVDIELKFHPGEKVDAKLIGTLQTIVSFDKGKISLPSGDAATLNERTIPEGEAGAGTRVDQLSDDDYTNPMYATGVAAEGDDLGDTATNDQWGKHGFHFKDEKGKLNEQDATLIDKPTRPDRGENANQTFESTALAIEGTQQGTYYGSVQWGWESDAKGNFKQLPLSLKSNDVPTDTFAKASERWNDSTSASGKDTIDVPIVKGKYVNSPLVWLVTNPSQYKSTRTDKLPVNARVEVTDKGEGKKFNQVSEDKYIWWKVTVVDGDAIGKVGWVMQHFLSDDKVKTAGAETK
jgi:hypothetical protein